MSESSLVNPIAECARCIDLLLQWQWSHPSSNSEEFLQLVNTWAPRRVWNFRTSSPTRRLCAVIAKSLQLLKKQDIYGEPTCANVRRWCREPPAERVDGTWLHDLDLGSFLLNEEASQRLCPEGELQRAELARGRHVIISYAGMHWKYLIDSNSDYGSLLMARPGIEFMVQRLCHHALGAEAVVPARLIKVSRGDRALILWVQTSVKGPTLEDLGQRVRVQDICPQSMADLTLLSILTGPKDGGMGHYFLGTRSEGRPHLIANGSCMAFGTPWRVHSENNFLTEIRCGLFLLPGMDSCVDEQTRARFLERSPREVLLQWMKDIEGYNKKVEAMRAAGVFTTRELKGDPRSWNDSGLQLPIRFAESTILRVASHLERMQEFLIASPEATLHQLFAHIEPALAEYYRFLRNSDMTIPNQLMSVYETGGTNFSQSQGTQQTMIDSHNGMVSVWSLLVESAQSYDPKEIFIQFSPEEYLEKHPARSTAKSARSDADTRRE